MNNDYILRDSCRSCGQKTLMTFLTLKDTPLADSFKNDPNEEQKKYPLGLAVCRSCKLVQNICDVDDSILYSSDYGFYTGGSPSLRNYFADYAKWVVDNFVDKTNGFIVEIASNDGTLLENFKDKNILGIDPATSCAKIAQDRGIPTLVQHFNYETAKQVVKDKGHASLIMANNVIAHVNNVDDFFLGIEELLDKHGVFIAEFQYFPHLLFNNEFDNVYHEHKSFYSLLSLSYILDYHGLKIVNILETPQQGGSLRVAITKKGNFSKEVEIEKYLSYESKIGLDRPYVYESFQARVDYSKITLIRLLEKLRKEGKVVRGFGASAKSCTLLNHCGITTDLITCIEDSTEYKFGKYTPGTNIPIVREGSLEKRADYYLLLVWNYLPKLLKTTDYKFIVPIPVPQII